jgi:hypothetical protein
MPQTVSREIELGCIEGLGWTGGEAPWTHMRRFYAACRNRFNTNK